MARSSGGLRRLVAAPLTWHVASLAVGLVFILALQRSQWFFFDEWAFLKVGGPGYFEPHVGHWSTMPMLVFHFLRDALGMASYMPFAIAVTLVHLAVAHLVWRIALRARANAWIATAAVAVLVVLGSGGENILWGFQVGFLGAFALGLLAFLLADAPVVGRGRLAAIFGVSAFSLAWSGTAIPLVVATAALLWHRHGWRKAALYSLVCAAVYGAWYLAFAVGNPNNPDTGGFGLEKLLIRIPQFLGVMLLLGWDSVFPFIGIGVAVLLALSVWLIVMWRRKTRLAGFAPALILLGAAVLFAFMAAYSRAEWSIGAGRSSRYIYVLVALLLPLCVVALTRFARERRAWVVSVCGVLLGLVGFQAWTLVVEADRQAALEAHSRGLISAALQLYLENPASVDPLVQPDAEWAPDVTLGDIVVLYERGALPVGPFTEGELDEARAVVLIQGEAEVP
jgi:hypothetical protein